MLKEEGMIRVVKSLEILTANRINTPLIFFSCATKSLDNAVQLKAMVQVTKPKHTFKVPENPTMSRLELEEYIKDYEGQPIVVFVSPKTPYLVSGTCTPGPYHNRIKIAEDTLSVFWGMPIDKIYPPALRLAVLDLNSMLQRFRHSLDGMELNFTYHPKGEGVTGDRVLIWGSPIEG